MAEVEEMDEKSAITLFIEAIRASDLYKSMRQKALVCYIAMMAKADRYAKAEETNRLKRREEERANKKNWFDEAPKCDLRLNERSYDCNRRPPGLSHLYPQRPQRYPVAIP